MNPLRLFQKNQQDGFALNQEQLPRASETQESVPGAQTGGYDTNQSFMGGDFQGGQESWGNQGGANPQMGNLPGGGNPIEGNQTPPPQQPAMSPGDLNQAWQQQPAPASSSSGANTGQLQSIETRLQMMDGRIGAIEQKMELLLKLIESEVSEETKQRFRIEESMQQRRQ